jgi:hypothetical protein
MIRVVLPQHLRILADVEREVRLEVDRPVTLSAVLNELETRYPMLRGTVRDQVTLVRRPMVRFFACQEDISFSSPDALMPEAVAAGNEPLFIVGAIAGG